MTEPDQSAYSIRPATAEDYEDVVRISQNTWDGDDYLQDVYHDWYDGENRQTLVAETDGQAVGIAQMVLLSGWEAWGQGLRVDPDHRGGAISEQITYDLFDWARDAGAAVARAMVFSWNQAGLGQSRATGYQPLSSFRWLRPAPESDSLPKRVTENPDAAWAYWSTCAAREHLGGVALSMDESWAVQTLTRELLHRASDETRVLAVTDAEGTQAFTFRNRLFERENDGETERWAEYGVAAWDSVEDAETLLSAIAVDAAEAGADRTRVLIPETAQSVSDASYIRANIADEPDFIVEADLTGAHR